MKQFTVAKVENSVQTTKHTTRTVSLKSIKRFMFSRALRQMHKNLHNPNNAKGFASKVGRFKNTHPEIEEIRKSTVSYNNIAHDEVISDDVYRDPNFKQPPAIVSSSKNVALVDSRVTQSFIVDEEKLFNNKPCNSPNKAQTVNIKDFDRPRTGEDLKHFEVKGELDPEQDKNFKAGMFGRKEAKNLFISPKIDPEKRFPKSIEKPFVPKEKESINNKKNQKHEDS